MIWTGVIWTGVIWCCELVTEVIPIRHCDQQDEHML